MAHRSETHAGDYDVNEMVRTHYPVKKLPKDLRAGFPGTATVTIILKEDIEGSSDLKRAALVAGMRKSCFVGSEQQDDPVQRIRALRDEWDE
jgi:hypothetical protein